MLQLCISKVFVDLVRMAKRPDFVPQKLRRTPKQLLENAESLEQAAATLRAVARGMLAKPLTFLEIRYSPGFDAALLSAVEPYALDAKKKAEAKNIVLFYKVETVTPKAITPTFPPQLPPR